MTEVELGRMDLGRNQYVVSLELGTFQGRPKSIRPNSETVKIRPISFDPFPFNQSEHSDCQKRHEYHYRELERGQFLHYNFKTLPTLHLYYFLKSSKLPLRNNTFLEFRHSQIVNKKTLKVEANSLLSLNFLTSLTISSGSDEYVVFNDRIRL